MLKSSFRIDRDPIPLYPIRQCFPEEALPDVEAAVMTELDRVGLAGCIHAGQRIAIAAGSRGIASIVPVLRSVAAAVRRCGAEPFLVPAMGSHGGATAEGQIGVLASLGVTPESVGAPILSSMETSLLGHTDSGIPVFLDKNAAGADGILVVNRIKQHTDYSGPYESGLTKMIAIGLGKRDQPEYIHARGTTGLREMIPEVARYKHQHAPIRMGLALFEDGHERLRAVRACPAAEIESREPAWLDEVRACAPRLPFEELDLLIVEQFGKDISGAGMDPHVIGRLIIPGEPELRGPRITRIVGLGLTEATHGNAIGMGFCDFITQSILDAVDWDVTYTNGIISGFLQRLFVPITLPTEAGAIDAALFTLSRIPPKDLRIARIRSTLHLDALHCSPALLPLVDSHPRLARLDAPTILL